MRTYTNVFDLGDLKTALAEAFEIKNDRYKYEALGKQPVIWVWMSSCWM